MNTSNQTKFASCLMCALLGCGLAPSAAGQSPSGAEGLLNDSWVINVGGFLVTTDTSAQLNGRSSIKPEIDFDREFGDPSESRRVRADALWRITPEHHLRAMYFDNTNVRSRALERNLQWGDYTFTLGATAEFREKTRVFELAYEYAFMRRPTYELAGSIGVHYMDTKLQLSGTASFTDPAGNTTTASGTTRENTLSAPLPVIGLRGGWMLHRDWYLDAQGQVFKVKVGDVDGYWSDLRAAVTWMFDRHFGLGLGYNRFTTNVDVRKSDFDGKLKTGYSGLQAYLTGTF